MQYMNCVISENLAAASMNWTTSNFGYSFNV